jgi:hypothetical protein
VRDFKISIRESASRPNPTPASHFLMDATAILEPWRYVRCSTLVASIVVNYGGYNLLKSFQSQIMSGVKYNYRQLINAGGGSDGDVPQPQDALRQPSTTRCSAPGQAFPRTCQERPAPVRWHHPSSRLLLNCRVQESNPSG